MHMMSTWFWYKNRVWHREWLWRRRCGQGILLQALNLREVLRWVESMAAAWLGQNPNEEDAIYSRKSHVLVAKADSCWILTKTDLNPWRLALVSIGDKACSWVRVGLEDASVECQGGPASGLTGHVFCGCWAAREKKGSLLGRLG
jgi:hypothetical protein